MGAPVPLSLIIIGVSGSGKSEAGSHVATRLGLEFLDADNYHSVANKEKMHRGIPLTDEDRHDWLANLHEALRQRTEAGQSCVLACSALKRAYRDVLRAGLPGVRFFYLHIEHDEVAQRLAARKGHFFNRALLDSQFAALEEPGPDEATIIEENRPLDAVVDDIVAHAKHFGLAPA